MTYKWDKKKIITMLKKPESRADLGNLLMQTFNLFGLADGYNQKPIQVLNNDADLFKECPSLNNYICKFDSKEIEPLDVNKPETGVISQREALELVHDYYQSLGEPFYSIFLSIFNKRESNLKFVHNKREFGSKTIICPSNGEIYTFANFDGSISSVCTLIHEYAHAIGYKLRPFEERENAQVFFCEIESIFHTLLGLDHLQKIIPEENESIVNEKKAIVNDTINDTNIIRQKKLIISSVEDLPEEAHISLKRFKNFIIENYAISENELNKYLKSPAENTLPYLIGEYTAFELYHIYETDPEKAMLYYSIIIRIEANSIEDYFKQIEALNIKLGTNVQSYVRKIKA